MAPFTCMVCKCPTNEIHHASEERTDLCLDCANTILDDFTRIWPRLSTESKAVNAARMRLDNYKE